MMLVKQNGLGIGGVIGMLLALGVGACGDDFTSEDCRASHTCPEPVGGEGGAGPSGSGDAGSGAMEAGGKSGSGDAGSGAVEGPGGNGGSSAGECTTADECDNGDPTDGAEICSEDRVCAPGNAPPTIVSISPEADDVGVEPDTTVVITFSEPLDEASLADGIRLLDGDTVIEGELSHADGQVTFTPAQPLALLANYSITISTGVTDAEGAALLDGHTSAFTTRDGAWANPIDAATGYIYEFPRILPIAGSGDVLVSWTPQPTPGVFCPASARWFSRGTLGPAKLFTQGAGITECREVTAAVNAEGVAAVGWTEQWNQQYLQQYRGGEWPAAVGSPVSSYMDEDETTLYGVGVAPGGAVSFLQHRRSSGTYARRTNTNGAWVGAWADIASGHLGLSVPRFVFDRESNGFAAWRAATTVSSGVDEVVVARYTAADGWEQATALPGGGIAGSNSANDERGAPAIAVDDDGGAMALWLREDAQSGLGSMVSSRFTTARGWESPVVVSGALSVVNQDLSEAPGLAFDGLNYVAAWTASDGYVYSAVYDAELAQWAEYERRSSAGVHMGMPSLGVDAHGNLLVTWLHGTQAPRSLRFARYDARAAMWSDAQAIPGGTMPDLSYTAFGVGAGGHAAIIWIDRDTQGDPATLRLASFH